MIRFTYKRGDFQVIGNLVVKKEPNWLFITGIIIS